MKKWLLSFIITMITLSVSASCDRIAPWDVFTPKRTVTSSVYFCNTCGTPYGRIDIHLNRGFGYNTCEYTSVEVLVYSRFSMGGFPRYYFWAWAWRSYLVTFPAGSADGWASSPLTEGEQVHVDGNSEVIPSDVIVYDLMYCY
jgi:hypothetical protein